MRPPSLEVFGKVVEPFIPNRGYDTGRGIDVVGALPHRIAVWADIEGLVMRPGSRSIGSLRS
jgi:hypothetical protein